MATDPSKLETRKKKRPCHWRLTVNERHLFAPICVTLWLRPPMLTQGQRHKTCHPKSGPRPRQPCSYVNVSAHGDSWAWHIGLNMHVRHWPQRKHVCARWPWFICMCLCSRAHRPSWSECVTVTFPMGRSLTTVFICRTVHISSWVKAKRKKRLISAPLCRGMPCHLAASLPKGLLLSSVYMHENIHIFKKLIWLSH